MSEPIPMQAKSAIPPTPNPMDPASSPTSMFPEDFADSEGIPILYSSGLGVGSMGTPNPFHAATAAAGEGGLAPEPVQSNVLSGSNGFLSEAMWYENHAGGPVVAPRVLSSVEAKENAQLGMKGIRVRQTKMRDSEKDVLKTRRQKRLERNRESARLSRRRRKQYLEVLEDKVAQLSDEMDRGRRAHVADAIQTIRKQRDEVLGANGSSESLSTNLSRTSAELRLAATFRAQQLKSFCMPPGNKFTLWLTLQNDEYFRGGRAVSERLSAARIGERMIQNGTDRVTPAQTMWPLLCNEVGLSYDQEEKVRTFQRTLLQAPESWLARHTAFATDRVMESGHDALQALAQSVGSRESRMSSILSDEQKNQFFAHTSCRDEYLKKLAEKKSSESAMQPDYIFQISPEQHVAANLYILNKRLQDVLTIVPRAAPLVAGPAFKKLSRRPSFESLGARTGDRKDDDRLMRERSFPSTGSLKRVASEMSIEGEERPNRPTIDPVQAEEAVAHVVNNRLGHIQSIIPAGSALVQSSVSFPPTTYSVPPAVHTATPAALSAPLTPPTTLSAPPATTVSAPPAVTLSVLPAATLGAPPAATFNAPPPATLVGQAPTLSAPPSTNITPEKPEETTSMPTEAPVALSIFQSLPDPDPVSVLSSPPAMAAGLPPPTHVHGLTSDPKQQTSFLPAHLTVVPEEMWPAEAAEDFLLSFVDEDWAIGEGVEMETS